jgi:alpha-tubulin suppressor-like RCC1 family protein
MQCLALKDDGTVDAWSRNRKGEITFDNIVESSVGGNDGKTYITTIRIMNGVVKINGQILSNIVSIATGNGFSIGLKRDGTVIEWSENSATIGPSNVIAIAAAGFTSLALKEDGTVVEWGSGISEEVQNQVPGITNAVAVAIGESSQGERAIALKKDGTVTHWGEETTYKDATPPAGLSNVVAIAAGQGHSLALKNDGTVIGWGFNDVGQATGSSTTNDPNIPTGQVMIGGQVLSDVASIAANHRYSLALKKDGTVVGWGRMVNGLYPATVPAGLSNVVAIAAGNNFCLAITTNSAVAEKFQQK